MKAGRKQQGMTLIELSMVLVIMGLIAAVLLSLAPSMMRLASDEASLDDVSGAQNAIAGFAASTGRLPCADSDLDGRENCPVVVGGFPYLTVGMGAPLRNASGYDYRYAVYARGDSNEPMRDTDLTRAIDRWQPAVVAELKPVVTQPVLGNITPLDLCRALGVAQGDAADDAFLNVKRSGVSEGVAYVLVDPGQADSDGNGSVFDGLNEEQGMGFEHPVRSASRISNNGYDDRVSAVRFNQLWEQLGCSAQLSTAGHAHPNVLSMLAIFRQTILDYKAQLELAEEMAYADVIQTNASIAGAASGIASSLASAPVEQAQAINTAGATAATIPASYAAIGANGALTGTAIAAQTEARSLLADVREHLKVLKGHIDDLNDLHDSVRAHVEAADKAALSNH